MPESHEIPHDTIYPRDQQHRFRLYARRGRDLVVLVTAPTLEGIGGAMGVLHQDARAVLSDGSLGDYGRIGILDVLPERGMAMLEAGRRVPVGFGEWILNPFDGDGTAGRLIDPPRVPA